MSLLVTDRGLCGDTPAMTPTSGVGAARVAGGLRDVCDVGKVDRHLRRLQFEGCDGAVGVFHETLRHDAEASSTSLAIFTRALW